MIFEVVSTAIIISLISFIGIITFYIKRETLKKYLWILIAFASGTLLSAAFFNLIPESLVHLGNDSFLFVLGGIILSYSIESLLHWHHCRGKCEEEKIGVKPYAYLNLIGDGIHNFIDGIVLGAAYLSSVNLGIITALAIILHEIPQELSDFGILLSGGFDKKTALAFNFISASTIIVGSALSYISANTYNLVPYLVGLAAGNFIYLSLSDLVPELKKERTTIGTIIKLAVIIIGIIVIYLVSTAISH